MVTEMWRFKVRLLTQEWAYNTYMSVKDNFDMLKLFIRFIVDSVFNFA